MDEFTLRVTESRNFFEFAYSPEFQSKVSSSPTIFSQRCTRCLLNEKAARILDSGICQICSVYENSSQHASNEIEITRQKKELHELLLKAQGAGESAYDILLMYSGGKDSAYLLDQLRLLYPRLRILAFFVESGFASEVAHQNIKYTFNKVDVSFEMSRPHFSLFRDLFRHCLINFGTRGGYETIDRADGDCLFDVAKNYASRNKIPLILSGLSRVQCEDILGIDSYEMPIERSSKKRTHIAGFALSDIYDTPDYRYWWSGAKNGEFSPRLIFPFFCWDYNEDLVRKIVADKELLPVGLVDPIVTNHRVIPLILALDYLRVRYCTFEPEFSKLVREGKAVREQWLPIFQGLEYLAPRGEFMPESIRSILAELDLSAESLQLPLMNTEFIGNEQSLEAVGA